MPEGYPTARCLRSDQARWLDLRLGEFCKGSFAVKPIGQAIRLCTPRRAVAHFLALALEASLGNNSRRGRVVAEMTDGEIGEAVNCEGILHERTYSLGGVAHAPIRLADPVAELGMILTKSAIPGAADQLACQYNPQKEPFLATA